MRIRTEDYAPRPIRFLELWSHGGWRLKVYGIAYRGSCPSEALIGAARRTVEPRLPQPAVTPDHYGVGFVGIHEGRGLNLVFLDWWADENELRHHVFTSTPDEPHDLKDVTATGQVACVWDLAVMGFERRAWIDHVLTGPGEPDLEGYLARRLDGVL